MIIRMVRCDVCGKQGDMNREPGWRILRDFSVCRHACPVCSDAARRWVGASHLTDTVLCNRVRDKERNDA